MTCPLCSGHCVVPDPLFGGMVPCSCTGRPASVDPPELAPAAYFDEAEEDDDPDAVVPKTRRGSETPEADRNAVLASLAHGETDQE